MTLRDLFTDKSIWNQYGDMDVFNDCIDDYAPAWCGTLLTDKGLEHFGKELDLDDIEVEFYADTYGHTICVHIDKFPDYEEKWEAIRTLFSCAAGYCGCEEYDLWFDENIRESALEPVFDDHKALCLLIDHTPIDRIKEAIAEDERLLPFLESIGYNTKNLKEA